MPLFSAAVRLVGWFAVLLVLSGCLDDGGSDGGPVAVSPTPTPQIAEVSADQTLFFMPTIGETVTVGLSLTDASGAARTATVTWASDAPDVVSVDSLGNLTALAIGSASITATVASGDTVTGEPLELRVDVTVADVKSDVVVIDKSALQADALILDYREDATFTSRIQVSGIDAIAMGDGIILSDMSLAGRVTAVSETDGIQTLDVSAGMIGPLLENGRISVTMTQDDLIEPESFVVPVATPATSTKTGAEVVGSQSETDARGIPTEITNFEGLLTTLFDSQFSTSISQEFSCKADVGSNPAGINTNLETELEYRDVNITFEEGAESGLLESGSVAINVEFDVMFDGYIDWTPTLNAKLSCKKILKAPFWQRSLLVVSIPMGVGFTLEGDLSLFGGRANIDGTMPVTISMQVGYDDLDIGDVTLEAPLDIEVNTDDLNITYELVDDGNNDFAARTVKLDVEGFIAPRAGIGIGITAGIYKLMDHLQGGVRASLDSASAEFQARDDSYKADAKIDAYVKRTIEYPYQNFAAPPMLFVLPTIILLQQADILDVFELLNFDKTLADIANSPTGVTTLAPLEPVAGDPVSFSLTLNPANFLGVYQIDEVIVYQVNGSGPSTTIEEFIRFTADDGQTIFEWDWLPVEADVGTVSWTAFATSRLFEGTVFQVDDVFDVNVTSDVPTPETINEARARVSVNGILQAPGQDARAVFFTDDQSGEGSATAGLNVPGISASAQAANGQLTGDIFFSSRQCGNVQIDVSADFDSFRSGLPIGTIIAANGSLTGPVTVNVVGDSEDLPTDMEVYVDASVSGSVSSGFSDDRASGNFRFNRRNTREHLTWDSGDEYQGGTYSLQAAALEVGGDNHSTKGRSSIDGKPSRVMPSERLLQINDAEVSASLDAEIELNLPCELRDDEEQPNKQVGVTFTLGYSF
ncbi:MAG: Ig-like domain-containing protein [Pseudomonadota bacterium]